MYGSSSTSSLPLFSWNDYPCSEKGWIELGVVKVEDKQTIKEDSGHGHPFHLMNFQSKLLGVSKIPVSYIYFFFFSVFHLPSPVAFSQD